MKFAITQMAMSPDYEENIAKADAILASAKKDGADCVLLPELFEYPYFCKREDYRYFDLAEDFLDSKTLVHYQKLAIELGLVLPISFFEKAPTCYFNSLALIDRDGEIKGLYRKSHIPTGEGYEEKFYFTPGNTGISPIASSAGKLGIGICWDQWFPETSRILALSGADILMFPTAIGSEPVTGKDSRKHWQNAMIGSSAQNVLPLLASNRIGKEDDMGATVTFFGHSFATNQYGEVIAEMDENTEGYRIVEYDFDALRKERTTWGVFRDRRTDLYHDLLLVDPRLGR